MSNEPDQPTTDNDTERDPSKPLPGHQAQYDLLKSMAEPAQEPWKLWALLVFVIAALAGVLWLMTLKW
jgi:hypothetical protein